MQYLNGIWFNVMHLLVIEAVEFTLVRVQTVSSI